MLSVNQQTIPLGKVIMHKPYTFQYILKNEGSEQVKIETLSVGCGKCTKASTPNPLVDKNQTAVINVVFTPDSTGIQKKAVNVHYRKGGKRSSLLLNFTAEVQNG